MAKSLTQGPRFDSRGLPEGYDPGELYSYRHATLVKNSTGIESFLYKLIPPSIFKSVAFAIDPTYRFKVSPVTITAANRVRYRNTASVLQSRSRTKTNRYVYWSQESNYKGLSLCSSPYLVYTDVSSPGPVDVLTPQQPLPEKINDTTSRTRIPGSLQGELEFFKYRLSSPGRTTRWPQIERKYTTGIDPDETCRAVGGMRDYETGTDSGDQYDYAPSSATLSLDTYTQLVATETDFCKALAAQYAIPMLKGIGPFNRDYSLLRNAIELRDVPRGITQLAQSMTNLRKVFDSFASNSKTRDLVFDLKRSSADIPKEYLGFHFGWKQTYKDLCDLLDLPAKMSKRTNFLIARSGKPTTFRSKREHLSSVPGASGFSYESVSNHEFGIELESRIERKSEIRLVVNATFDFPPINDPRLNRKNFYGRIGLSPRFIDVYNLTPWTWLVDWFTGLGTYLELIENINHDPSLINWGMITVKTDGSLITEYRSRTPTSTRIYQDNVEIRNTVVDSTVRHQSRLDFECQTRQDVASVLDVRRTSVPSSLTGYQYSILGSILAQRTSLKK